MKRKISATIIFFIGIAILVSTDQRYFLDGAERVFAQSEALLVICSADRLFIDTEEPVILRAYTNPKDDGSFSYAWTVTAGRIEGHGSQVRWNLTGTKPSICKLNLQVTDRRGQSDATQLEVVVIKPLDLKGGKYTTGRAFLVRGEEEAQGYGLYSYLLFGSRPGDSKVRERYLSAIRAYLRLSHVTELLEVLKEKKEININSLPLKKAPDQALLENLNKHTESGYSEVSAWVLENYDYEIAQSLLKRLEGDNLDGPYIVSFQKPATTAKMEPPYLYQNQSNVPPHLVDLWMKEFILQAAQERFWERKTMYHTVLKMRTYVGIIGEGIPEVTNALNTLIGLIDKLKKSS